MKQSKLDFAPPPAPSLPTLPDDALSDLVFAERLPFRIVNSLAFRNFVKVIQHHPKWAPPSRTKLATAHLNDSYQDALGESKKLVSDCFGVSVTTDGTKDYWSITIHGADKNGKLRVSILGCIKVNKRHSAANLADALRPMLAAVGLTVDKLFAFVTDEGGAAPCIGEQFLVISIHCSAHLLQTSLKRAFKEITNTEPIIAIVIEASKATINLFRNSDSSKELASLQRQLNLPITSLVKDVATRFNSTYYALKSVKDNKQPILNWIMNHEAEVIRSPVYFLHANHSTYWPIISDLVDILEPFEAATKTLAKDKEPTLHLLIAEVMSLRSTLTMLESSAKTTECVSLVVELRKQLKAKFEPWHKCELMALALCPHFYHVPGLRDLFEQGVAELDKELICSTTPSQNVVQLTPNPAASSLAQRYSSLLGSKSTPNAIAMDVDLSPTNGRHPDIATYCKLLPHALPDVPILEWWASQLRTFPDLAPLALKVLAIPSSQNTSEREFSLLRLLHTHLRGNMSGETTNKLVTATSHIQKRYAAISELNMKPRSAIAVEADSRRQLSRDATTRSKAAAREGDYTEPVLWTIATTSHVSTSPNADAHYDKVEEVEETETVGWAEPMEQLGDGERDSDEDWSDSESEDDTYTAPPAPKRVAALAKPTLADLVTSSVNKELFIGMFDVAWQDADPPTLKLIFGDNGTFFEDLKLSITDVTKRGFTFRLSKLGKKKFKTGRRGALAQIGEIQHLQYPVVNTLAASSS